MADVGLCMSLPPIAMRRPFTAVHVGPFRGRLATSDQGFPVGGVSPSDDSLPGGGGEGLEEGLKGGGVDGVAWSHLFPTHPPMT